jgi:hypothetical protein
MKRWILGGFLLALTVPAFSQETASPLFSGKEVPLTLKMKDLSSEWRRVSVGSLDKSGDSSNMMSQLMQMGMMSEMGKEKKPGAKPEDPMTAMLGMQMLSGLFGGLFGGMFGGQQAPVYYTLGKTVNLGSETFLIAYRYKKKEMNLAAMMAAGEKEGGKEPDMEKLMADGKMTEESPITLSLLNLKAVGSLSDIRPFDLKTEIEEANAAGGGGLMDMFAQGMGKGAVPDAAEEGKAVNVAPDFGETDEPVARLVSNALTKDAQLKGNLISVAYDGDTVTLSGTVKSVAQKNRAATVAKSALATQKVTASVKNGLLVRAKK